MAGEMSLADAIAARRSVRAFDGTPLTTDEVLQLCWAGQGVTDAGEGLRASPSAGALYPIELYIVTPDGVGHYRPKKHGVVRHLEGDLRAALQDASIDQEMIGESGACVVIAAVVERVARKYGRRAERYCTIEAGHVAQNMLLQATVLGLGSVPIGAFEDRKVAGVLKLPKGHRPTYVLAIGHAR